MTAAIPTLSKRAAREQKTFRTLLEAMARPGTVWRVAPHEQGEEFAPAIALLEALLDHEVSFAVLPEAPGAQDALLRYTGSRAVAAGRADFLLCHGDGIGDGLARAKEGELEYPDRSATIVALIESVADRPGSGDRLTLSGPGIKDTIDVWVAGFAPEQRAVFAERNLGVPLGVDLVLVDPEGHLTCLPRYTRISSLPLGEG